MRTLVKRGHFGGYAWIESPDISPRELFSALQKEITGTTMVVATFDSGSLYPNESETKMGWYSKNGALYAPRLEDVNRIPLGTYDEIYFFAKEPLSIEYERFVNIGSFSMGHEDESGNQAKLMAQVIRLQPKIVLMNGDNIILMYRKDELGERVEERLGFRR